MNKGDLIEALAAEMKASRTDAAKALDAVLAAITQGLKADEKVAISGFGTFQRKQRAARTGINPATKAQIQIPASTTCGFKPASALKDALTGT
jgi:DNA-binding protein HU-beta